MYYIRLKKEVGRHGSRMLRVEATQVMYHKHLPVEYRDSDLPVVFLRGNKMVVKNVRGQSVPDSLTGETDAHGSCKQAKEITLNLNTMHTVDTVLFFVNMARRAMNRLYSVLDSQVPDVRDEYDEVIEQPSQFTCQDPAITWEALGDPNNWVGTVTVKL